MLFTSGIRYAVRIFSMIVELNAHDKRRERRVPAANLTAQIKVKKGLFSDWVDLNVLDFNLLGLALALPSEPELGNKLSLKLALKMDMGDLKLNQIEAKIVNKMKIAGDDSMWRVGVVFSNSSKNSGDNLAQLTRIKDMLERNEAIKQRLVAS
jgi:hypothetical protein